jgi:hypothetical protein
VGKFVLQRNPDREDQDDENIATIAVSINEKGLIWFDSEFQPRMTVILFESIDKQRQLSGFSGIVCG